MENGCCSAPEGLQATPNAHCALHLTLTLPPLDREVVGARGHCLTNLMGVPFWFISNHGYIKFVLCAALRNASSAGYSWKQITPLSLCR